MWYEKNEMMVLVRVFMQIILWLLGDLHATKHSLYDMVMTDENEFEEKGFNDNDAQYVYIAVVGRRLLLLMMKKDVPARRLASEDHPATA